MTCLTDMVLHHHMSSKAFILLLINSEESKRSADTIVRPDQPPKAVGVTHLLRKSSPACTHHGNGERSLTDCPLSCLQKQLPLKVRVEVKQQCFKLIYFSVRVFYQLEADRAVDGNNPPRCDFEIRALTCTSFLLTTISIFCEFCSGDMPISVLNTKIKFKLN